MEFVLNDNSINNYIIKVKIDNLFDVIDICKLLGANSTVLLQKFNATVTPAVIIFDEDNNIIYTKS